MDLQRLNAANHHSPPKSRLWAKKQAPISKGLALKNAAALNFVKAANSKCCRTARWNSSTSTVPIMRQQGWLAQKSQLTATRFSGPSTAFPAQVTSVRL